MMTEMQKQFEEWAKTRWTKPNLSRYLTGYENGTINEQWQAWQASRAAVVVKLPNSFHDKYEQYVYDAASLELSLDEAGIKYE